MVENVTVFLKTLVLLDGGDQEHCHWTSPVKGGVNHIPKLNYSQCSVAWDLEPGATTPTVGENYTRAVTCNVLFYSDLFLILFLGSQVSPFPKATGKPPAMFCSGRE